jgi:hypothetical protein
MGLLTGIGSISDFAQKLFGRSFAVVAWLPALSFSLVAVILLVGSSDFREAFNDWTGSGTRSAAAKAFLFLGCVTVLAYLLFGIRTWIREVFQGNWPGLFPMNLISGILIARGDHERAAGEEAEGVALDRLDVMRAWQRGKLKPSYSANGDASAAAFQSSLAAAKRFGRWWNVEGLCNAVIALSRLKGFADKTRDPDLTTKTAQFEQDLRTKERQEPNFKRAVALAETRCARAWIKTFDKLSRLPTQRYAMPTGLGNALNRLADYPQGLYGVDLDVLWPRLDFVIPDKFRGRIDDSLDYMDFCCIAAFLVWTAMIWSAVVAARSGGFVAIVVAVAGGPVGVILYQLAKLAAVAYTQRVQAAIDLFRFDLLEKLHVALPQTPAEEAVTWRALNAFMKSAAKPESTSILFVHPKRPGP